MRYSLFLALLLFALTAVQADELGQKRFIGHSWDLLWVNTQDLVRNQAALEKLPLDGISISIYAQDDAGKRINLRAAMTEPPWERRWFEEEISRVRQISAGKFKHNLICTFWAPRRRLAWNDDAAWANAAHNMAIAAWIAREGGAKGLLMDPEDYPKSQQYTLLPEDGAYLETAALARQRGAQMMQAMAAEYPDITLLSFWLFSMNRTLYQRKVDLADYAHTRDILWPHFLNGFLDAIPPDATLVDATENGYRFEAANMDFYLSAWEIAKRAPLLVAPENRAKYRNQVQAGFGLYLDMYTNDEKSYWYFGPINGSRLNHLRTNFHQASSASDQYCWVYGEKFRWIKWDWNLKDRDAPTWEEQLPGFARTLALITDPIEGSRRILDEGLAEGTLVNLVSNPDCSPLKQGELKHAAADWTAGNLPEGWSFWRRDEKEGDFGLDTSKGFGDSYSARATGVDDGCFIVRVPAAPGNAYLVECYTVGEGNPNLRARWQKEGKWVVPNKDVMISYDKRVNTSQWRRAVGVVDVPPEADSLILLMATRLAPNQTAWFDKPGIYLLQEQVEHLSERTTKNMESQEVFMKQAIELASEGVLQNYGGPFGAIVVKDGKIVGRGHNRVTSTNDPTAHAEVMAIRDACKNLNTFLLTDCDLYTSCEPCPMCFGAIYWAHIKRVYFSATRDTASDFGFDDGLIYREVALPIKNRRVQFIPLLPEQGVGPFQIWNKKQNKIEY